MRSLDCGPPVAGAAHPVSSLYLTWAYWCRCPWMRRMLPDAVPKMHDTGRARTPMHGDVPNPLDPPPCSALNPRCPNANDRCRSERPVLQYFAGSRAACHAVQTGRI